MSASTTASRIDLILAQFKTEVGNFEKALLERINIKKQKKERSELLMKPNRTDRQLKDVPIAIIGMASLFPEAKNLREYWDNIMREVDCIRDVPPSRWDIDTYYDPDPKAQDKTYCKRGGFIPDVDFNPLEFGLPPNILEFTDMSQIISLVIAKQAMEDAGYGEAGAFDRERTGVILGAAVGRPSFAPLAARMQYPTWEKVLKSSGVSDEDTRRLIEKMKLAYVEWEENSFPGMLTNVIAGRIANRLDFGGTNCAIDAACASSLSAFKMAASELLEYRADLMLTGGIDIDNSIVTYLCFSKTPAFSRNQEIRPFDADSDGMLVGEGVGMLVLKRLEDAERDGDRIYAVIKGIGTSSDGRYKSIYAPRPEGQVKALNRAYEDAGFSPASVGLIEAHGTGTAAGDPAEFSALNQVFTAMSAKQQSIALGSVKSQIGHTKAAAGAASLIKAALALHHKVLPATIKISRPNPKLGIEASPFYLNTQTRPWIRNAPDVPRRAGVSSFGFGGANFHLVLEEYQGDHQHAYRLHSSIQSILLMAATVTQLTERCQALLEQLRSDTDDRVYKDLVDASKTLEIPVESPRLGFVAGSRLEACTLLQLAIESLQKNPATDAWSHPQGIYYRKTGLPPADKLVALFSGQGSQYLNMGRELTLNFPALRQNFSEMDGLFVKDGLQPLSAVVFPVPAFEETQKSAQAAALQQTHYAQPAIAVFSTGLYKILQQAGLKPDFVAGHSFGELTALWAAGVFSDSDYYALVKARGQAMAAPSDPTFDAGAMLAVKGDVSRIEAILKSWPQVSIANFNSGRQVVLAGAKPDIARVQQVLQEQGYSVVLLPVSAAFHTPLVAHAQQPFAQAVESVAFASPTIPVYTNVTGQRYPAQPQTIQSIVKDHMVSQVCFKQEIEAIYNDGGRCFVEFGPRNVLTNLVNEILGDRPHVAIALNPGWRKDSDRQLREAAVQLRVVGVHLTDLDPYQLVQKIPDVSHKAKTLSVRLSAMNYVSEKTKTAFDQALQDGHRINIVQVQDGPDAVTAVQAVSADSKTESNHKPDIHSETILQTGSSQSEYTNGSSQQNGNSQSEYTNGNSQQNGNSQNGQLTKTAAVTPVIPVVPFPSTQINSASEYTNGNSQRNENFQNGQSTQTATVTPAIPGVSFPSTHVNSTHANVAEIDRGTSASVLVQQTSKPKGTPMSQPPLNYQRILESLEYSLTQFSHYQQDILQVHEQYLKQHMEYAQVFLNLTHQHNALLNPECPSDEQPQQRSAVAEGLERSMMQFHHHHAETLRVHEQSMQQQTQYANSFFQVLEQQYSGLVADEVSPVATPQAEPVADKVTDHEAQLPQEKVTTSDWAITVTPDIAITASAAATEIAQPPELIAPPIAKQDAIASNGSSNGSSNGAGSGQAVITAKEETVIPSVSAPSVPVSPAAMPTHPVPELAEIRPANTTELSTPVQPVEVKPVEVKSAAPKQEADLEASVAVNVAATVAATIETPIAETPIAAIPQPTAETDIDLSALIEALLSIVSEKTGYPAEMLELDLDMEADLGIDSIKRVEILAAMQQQFPDYPQVNPEDMGELRTLGRIIEQMRQYAQTAEKKTAQPPVLVSSPA